MVRKLQVALLVAIGAATIGANEASAVLIYSEGLNVGAIAGVTDSATTGAEMGGLLVTATFWGGGSETAMWMPTGATSGSAVGTGWSLSLTGDSFGNLWIFDFTNPMVGFDDNLASLVLDARGTTTIFDRTGLPSTPGSDAGADWTCGAAGSIVGVVACGYLSITGDAGANILVNYDYGVGSGDLFEVVHVSFGGNGRLVAGIANDFSFRQDTDSVEPVPEPGTLLLLGSGITGLALKRRRRSS